MIITGIKRIEGVTVIRVGCKGCGKSEQARKALGMTHEEYATHGKQIEEMIRKKKEYREFMENLFIASYIVMNRRLT